MDENTIIKMELPLGAWNYLITVLADQKYRDAVNIINEFSRQAQPQLDAAMKAKQDEAPSEPLPEAAE